MPVKFDDIPKSADEVLNDDYVAPGYSFKAKQKTNFDGAVVTSAVDLWPGKDKDGKDAAVKTPGKLTWKFPKPFGIAGFVIDKLEMDKAGKFKLEVSADKGLHSVSDLKVDAKTDLIDVSKISTGMTYTGVKDAQMKMELKPMNPKDATAEVTYAMAPATLGVKYSGGAVSAGCRVLRGDLFGSVLANKNFQEFSGHMMYKCNEKLKVACTAAYGGKAHGSIILGCSYDVNATTKVKAKATKDGTMLATCKHEVAKGVIATLTGKLDGKKGDHSYGVSLSIE